MLSLRGSCSIVFSIVWGLDSYLRLCFLPHHFSIFSPYLFGDCFSFVHLSYDVLNAFTDLATFTSSGSSFHGLTTCIVYKLFRISPEAAFFYIVSTFFLSTPPSTIVLALVGRENSLQRVSNHSSLFTLLIPFRVLYASIKSHPLASVCQRRQTNLTQLFLICFSTAIRNRPYHSPLDILKSLFYSLCPR